jgi:hypothetical protein
VGLRSVVPRPQGSEGSPGARRRHEEVRGDRGCGGQVVLSSNDSADQGSGSPHVQVLGAIRPHTRGQPKISKEEMAARVSQIYSRKVKVKKCPKAHSLKRPANRVRF